MLFLAFRVGPHRYAIDSSHIAEILPLVGIDAIARAPVEVAGIFHYRGAPVPVIDLSQLLEGRPSGRRMSTRIVIVHYPDTAGGSRLVGLIAEKATEMIRREEGDFVDSGVVGEDQACLGPVATDGGGLIQRLEIDQLLTARHRALFRSAEQECLSPTSKTC